MIGKIVYIIDLMRVRQWVKNFFIFFPLIFAGKLYQPQDAFDCFVTLAGFCLVSSSVYIFNDLLDIKYDRVHPKKSKRPLVQGPFNLRLVIAFIIALVMTGLFICFSVSREVFLCALTYIALNLVYNFYTKKIVILDVVFVAFGFQVRIWAGSFAAGVFPSVWLQMCVLLLALFLGFTKRRHEISTLKDKAGEHRSVLAHYTAYLLDQIIIICSTLTIVFYGLYVISADTFGRLSNQRMAYSLIFVVYGIFRYLYLVHVKKLGDEPGEIILSDPPILTNILAWIFYIGFVLYVIR